MNQAEIYLEELVDHHKTPGVSYYLFDKNQIIHQYEKGFANVGKEVKVNDETTFNVLSITKTFTAVAILQLFEKKRLDIDQSAKKYLPDFPYSSMITIRQLLTHSAGIPNPIPLSWIHLKKEHASFDRNRFFNNIFVKHPKTRSNPNERFYYSNLGYFLLGRIVENVSAINFEQYVRDNIIKKLDLQPKDLDFVINDASKHAKGYIKRVSFSNMILGFFIHKSKYMEKAENRWKPFKNYYVNGTSYGGLIGTPVAFVKYIQELLRADCRLITSEHKKLLFTENVTSANKATGMCLAWFSGTLNGKQYFAHAGGGGGYYCEIRIYPELEIGSVIMFNRTGMKDERFLNIVDKYFFAEN